MKKVLAVVVLLISTNLYSQNIYNKLMGYTNENVAMRDSATSKILHTTAKDLVVFSGIDNTHKGVYKIVFYKKVYYIDKDDVNFVFWKNINTDSINSLSPDEQSKLDSKAKYIGSLIGDSYFNKYNKFLDKARYYGVILDHYSNHKHDEYTDAQDFEVAFYNPTKKTIKYIWITLKGYNSVDDPVMFNNGRYTSTKQCIGPIAPRETSRYNFEYVWFDNIVEYGLIQRIKIQYMDRTIKIINNVSNIEPDMELQNRIDEIIKLGCDNNNEED